MDKRLEKSPYQGNPPFDPKSIHIETKPIPLEAIVRRIQQGTILLTPDFQRNQIWNNTKKSLLIESLMLNIPIPLFYVSCDEDNRWSVIDGLQRLTAIKEFCIEKTLVLRGLEFFTKFDNKHFDDLPPLYLNRIMETTLQVVIVEPTTDSQVKFNIFKRINTGGVVLNAQEIRHALYYGPGTRLLDDLVRSKEMQMVFGKKPSDNRMKRHEMVLRTLSFLLFGYQKYGDDFSQDRFLCEGLITMNAMESDKDHDKECGYKTLSQLEDAFSLGLHRGIEMFGKSAFRIQKGSQRGSINGSLFEVFITLLSELNDEAYGMIQGKGTLIMEMLGKEIGEKKEFYRALSRDPWTRKNVTLRFVTIQNILKEASHADT